MRLKISVIAAFAGLAAFGFGSRGFVEPAGAYSTGPPAAHTGAPGETTCIECHQHIPGAGAITVTVPAEYALGQTYQIVVRHTTTDTTRQRWGFQLTALANNTQAGNLESTSGTTQVLAENGRQYIEHTLAGTFPLTTNTVFWTFNWTAPATNVGPVTFYAAGNQANNDGNSTGDRILTTNATAQPPAVQQMARSPYDFDGDGKTDISIFRQNLGNAEWWISRSSTNDVSAFVFGAASDVPVPADITGDGKADVAIFRPATGEWFVLRSEDNSFFAFPFGANGDIPMPADFDGDGKTDPAVFRPSQGLWFIQRSSDNQTTIAQFGTNGDQPIAADYDGDGKADIAIIRRNAGNMEWWMQRTTAGFFVTIFGVEADKAVPGDYTGDGKADIAIFRPSNGNWFVLRSEDFSFFAFPFGQNGDVPVPGDYDGDGKFDAAVFRPPVATWFVNRSGGSGTLIAGFGVPTDQPIPSVFVR